MADLMILGGMARKPKPMLRRAKMDICSRIWLIIKERRIRRFGNRNEFGKPRYNIQIVSSVIMVSMVMLYASKNISVPIYNI